MDRGEIESPSPQCECGVLPLYDRPIFRQIYRIVQKNLKNNHCICYPVPMEAKNTILGILKTTSFLGTAFLAAWLITSSMSTTLNVKKTLDIDQVTIASIPLKYTSFSDVGRVASPHIDTKIITNSGSSIPTTFLIDTGAKISALPMEYAQKVGLDTNTAKRIYLRSATNNTTYGYVADLNIKLNDTTMTIPVAFAEVIEPLLGTFGFLDKYSLTFDRGETIIIKANN